MSLHEITKKRILEEIIRPIQPTSGWKVLIVDKMTVRIMSYACRMYDIMEEGVTHVENIAIKRQPLPKMEAIYFLSPDMESIKFLIEDFQNENDPQYGTVHLYFTRRIDKEALDKLKKSNVIKFVKTFKEVNLEFLAYESSVFHLDSPEMFYSLFSPESKTLSQTQRNISDKIVSVCATLKEYPIIRYCSNLTVTGSIAKNVQTRLDELLKSTSDFSDSVKGNRSTLLILDRSVDVLSPVLHEFTYQAMIYDLLSVQNDIYKYESTSTGGEKRMKEILLSESDPLWPSLRHQHIADTIEQILSEFEEFVRENKASKFHSNAKKVTSLAEMSEAMKSMPQYQEMLAKYSLHIDMANECMKIFSQKNLTKVAGLEQDMATGEEADGKPAKNILSSLPTLLQSLSSKEDKIRLLIIYIVSQEGIKDSDRRRLLEFASISTEDENSIANLKYLGVTLTKVQAKNKQKLKEKKKKKGSDDVPPYELSRYVPALKKIIDDLSGNNLSSSEYPFVKESSDHSLSSNDSVSSGSSLRSQPRWADKSKRKSSKPDKPNSPTGPRIIIFIVGGITYSEMRIAYEMSQKLNREVFIGSTHLLNPKLFIDQLGSLKKFETV